MITTVYAGTDGSAWGQNAAYATARTTGAANDGSIIMVGQRFSGATYFCYEGFLTFALNTPLGDYGKFTITDVDLFLKTRDDLDATAFDLKVVGRDYGLTLDTADFVSGASISGTVLFQNPSTDFAAGAYEQLTKAAAWDNSALFAGTGTSSYLRFMLYSSRHAAGTTPTGNELLSFYDSSESGTTSDPYALIEWYSKDPVAGNLHGAVGPAAAWPRALSAEEVAEVVAQGMVVRDRALDSGTAVIQGDVRTAAGTTVPASHVRAGWWLQHLDYQPHPSDRPRPLLIQGHSVDLDANRNALTVGVDWMEREIGARMADVLALPEPLEASAVEQSAADPYRPETVVSEGPEETASQEARETTYWEGYASEEEYLKAHPWMR